MQFVCYHCDKKRARRCSSAWSMHRGTAAHRQRRRALCLRCLCLWVATPTLLAPMPVHRQACAPGWAGHRKGNRRRPVVLYWPDAFNGNSYGAVQYSTAVVFPSTHRTTGAQHVQRIGSIIHPRRQSANDKGSEAEKPSTYNDEGVAAEEAVDEPGGAAQEHGQGEQERHVLHALRLDHQPLHTHIKHSTCFL